MRNLEIFENSSFSKRKRVTVVDDRSDENCDSDSSGNVGISFEDSDEDNIKTKQSVLAIKELQLQSPKQDEQ